MLKIEEREELLKPKALPLSAHYKNPRNIMNKKIGLEIKTKSKERANFKCELCYKKYLPNKLHAHEMGKLDRENATITFNKIVALCENCHRIQHMGLTRIHKEQGKINIKEFERHLEKNLKIKKSFENLYHEFQEYFLFVEPWREYGECLEFDYIVKVNDFNEPLFTIGKNKEGSKFWEMAKRKSNIQIF